MNLRDELIQVAAVCVAWIEQIDHGSMNASHVEGTIIEESWAGEIQRERIRQDEKWGRGRTVDEQTCLAVLAEEVGEVARLVGGRR